MGNVASDTAVLAAGRDGRGGWFATPWDYSSMPHLWLAADGSGELFYGYGQTFYAVINCRWEVEGPQMHLAIVPGIADKAGVSRIRTPTEDKQCRVLDFTLTAGEVSGVESISGWPYRFRWMLEMSEPPWPPELRLPYKVPRVFYGHPEPMSKARRRTRTLHPPGSR